MGATADGTKELIAVSDGYRESEQSWKALLLDCQARGMTVAVGDGALGFWKALRQAFPTTREQRCWVHKTANVLDKLPKGQQPKAKAMLRIHLRTTNPIESTFATVRLRTSKTKGSGSRCACLTMVFKLMESAARSWRVLNGSPLLLKVIAGVRFVDGVEQTNVARPSRHPQHLTISLAITDRAFPLASSPKFAPSVKSTLPRNRRFS